MRIIPTPSRTVGAAILACMTAFSVARAECPGTIAVNIISAQCSQTGCEYCWAQSATENLWCSPPTPVLWKCQYVPVPEHTVTIYKNDGSCSSDCGECYNMQPSQWTGSVNWSVVTLSCYGG